MLLNPTSRRQAMVWWNALLVRGEKRLFNQVRTILFHMFSQVADGVDEGAAVKQSTKRLQAVFKAHYIYMARIVALEVASNTKSLNAIEKKAAIDDFFPDYEEWADLEAKKQADLMKKASKKTLKSVLGKVVGVANISQSIRKLGRTLSRTRARRVAEDQTAKAASQSQLQMLERLPITLKTKEWVTNIDGRERPSHAEADGQTVSFEDSFLVGGERLPAPRDDSLGASTENVINCRCAIMVFE